LNTLIGKPFEDHYQPGQQGSRLATDAVTVDGNQVYLVLEECPDDFVSNEKMDKCDLVCLLYDRHDPLSFAYIAKIQNQLSEKFPHIPVEYFETKSDLQPVQQVNRTISALMQY
jgi:Ras family protein T1